MKTKIPKGYKPLFISENTFNFIINILPDITAERNMSEQELIDNLLIQGLSSTDSHTAFAIQTLYTRGVNSALTLLYQQNVAKGNGECWNTDFDKIFYFGKNFATHNNCRLGDNTSEFSYLKNKWETLAFSSATPDEFPTSFDESDYISDVYNFIEVHWADLRQYELTYRVLMSIHKIINNPHERIGARNTLRKIILGLL